MAHTAQAEPDKEYCPATQLAHAPLLMLPMAEDMPAVQPVQDVEPVDGWKVPAPQLTQLVEPVTIW